MNRYSTTTIALSLTASLTGCAGQQNGTNARAAASNPLGPSPVSVAGTRPQAYRDMSAALDRLNAELKLPMPRLNTIVAEAARINEFALHRQYTLFPGGSGPETGITTRAKAQIWTQPAQFKIAQDMFRSRAQALADAATAGNLDAVRAQIPMLGQTCADCHAPFRVPAPEAPPV